MAPPVPVNHLNLIRLWVPFEAKLPNPVMPILAKGESAPSGATDEKMKHALGVDERSVTEAGVPHTVP